MTKLLLVEDDSTIVENLREFLAEEGFSVTAVPGQRQALEYRILLILFQNKGMVLTREKLLEAIWDVAGEFVNDNTLTVYIKRLREKIEKDPAHPEIIKTIRRMGYGVF